VGHRELLLAAARRLLAEKGYAHITARDLVAASGTNLASIGYHFGSKAELLGAAVGEALLEWAEDLTKVAMSDPSASPAERVGAVWVSWLRRLPANRHLVVSYMEALAQAERDPRLHEQFVGHYRRCREHAANLVAEAIGAPEAAADPRSQAIASWIISVCDGLAVQCLLDPEQLPTPDDFAAGLAGFWTIAERS
jgi:AcrR family transcriptional regulator